MPRTIDMTGTSAVMFSNVTFGKTGRFDGDMGSTLPDYHDVVEWQGEKYYRDRNRWHDASDRMGLIPMTPAHWEGGPLFCRPDWSAIEAPPSEVKAATFSVVLTGGVEVRFANQNQLMSAAGNLTENDLRAMFPGGLTDAINALGHHPEWLYEDVEHMDPAVVIAEMAAHQYLTIAVGFDNAHVHVFDMVDEIAQTAYETMTTADADSHAVETAVNLLSTPTGLDALKRLCIRYRGKAGQPCYC